MAKHGRAPTRQIMSKAAAKLRSKGRGGDTILAHISPQEANVLRKMGGKGTRNPKTGLPEFGHVGDDDAEFAETNTGLEDEGQQDFISGAFDFPDQEAQQQAALQELAPEGTGGFEFGDEQDQDEAAVGSAVKDPFGPTLTPVQRTIQGGIRGAMAIHPALAAVGLATRGLEVLFGPGNAPRVAAPDAGLEDPDQAGGTRASRAGTRATRSQAATASFGKSLKRTTPTLSDPGALAARFLARRRTAAQALASTRKTGGLLTKASTTAKTLFGGI